MHPGARMAAAPVRLGGAPRAWRLISATDTDVAIRKHGDSILFGYNAAVLASASFVCSIQVKIGQLHPGIGRFRQPKISI